VYASTEDILQKALVKANLLLGRVERIAIHTGGLLRIDKKGRITRSHFDDSKRYSQLMLPWTHWGVYEPARRSYGDDSEYLRDLKAVASCFGLFSIHLDIR